MRIAGAGFVEASDLTLSGGQRTSLRIEQVNHSQFTFGRVAVTENDGPGIVIAPIANFGIDALKTITLEDVTVVKTTEGLVPGYAFGVVGTTSVLLRRFLFEEVDAAFYLYSSRALVFEDGRVKKARLVVATEPNVSTQPIAEDVVYEDFETWLGTGPTP